jgi:hypothetical protein
VIHFTPSARALVLAFLSILASSCTQIGDSWMSKSMSAAAQNQIMLVRKEPISFGYQRLEVQSLVYPDLKLFISKHGLPDFLAETGTQNRQYFILYYLDQRKAFACRTPAGSRNSIEFAGPYPITDREYRLLNDFRRDPSKAPKKL